MRQMAAAECPHVCSVGAGRRTCNTAGAGEALLQSGRVWVPREAASCFVLLAPVFPSWGTEDLQVLAGVHCCE